MSDYYQFADHIRFDGRFVFEGASLEFLNRLAEAATDRLVPPSVDAFLYRSQINTLDDCKRIYPNCDPLQVVLTEERMVPIPDLVGDNRLSPKGIAYLYLADSTQTAISEVRPHKGASITVAKFSVEPELHVVDFVPRKGDDRIWADVDLSISIPTTPTDSWRSYLPTQCIAEFLKIRGFNGVKYRSAMHSGGYNIALFDPASAQIESRQLHYVREVCYDAVRETDRNREV